MVLADISNRAIPLKSPRVAAATAGGNKELLAELERLRAENSSLKAAVKAQKVPRDPEKAEPPRGKPLGRPTLQSPRDVKLQDPPSHRLPLRPGPLAESRAAVAEALQAAHRRSEAAKEAAEELRAKIAAAERRAEEALAIAAAHTDALEEASLAHREHVESLREATAVAAEELQAVTGSSGAEEECTKKALWVKEKTMETISQLRRRLAEEKERQAGFQADGGRLLQQVEALATAEEAAKAALELHACHRAEALVLARSAHNAYLSLKGNVRVFCRLRPLSDPGSEFQVDIQDEALTVMSPPERNITGLVEHSRSWTFDFDHVFRPDASQGAVFEEISLLVQSALDGYKVTIFAYGQTGSGKTHTMQGSSTKAAAASGDGLIPRSVDLVFGEVDELKRSGWNFEVQVSLVEVYNETLLDLLAAPSAGSSSPGTLQQPEQESCASEPSWSFQRRIAKDATAVYTLLRRAARERHVAATLANERSSRSHLVFQLFLSGQCQVQGQETKCIEGLLSFIDLAGSERLEKSQATGERLKESLHINRSLSALGDVIEAIARRSRTGGSAAALHIPFRNSRLTALLRDSLGGDSKVLMFVNLSTKLENLGESLSSLRFASKVHKCHLGVAKKNCVDR